MPAIAPVLELATLDGSNGFVVGGAQAGDEAGWSVASAGDVNGDGIDDFLVGAIYSSAGHPYGGATYVVFGSSHPFPANFDPTTLDGSNGFRIDGPSDYAASGFSVAALGDFNHDGVGDLIIGAPGVDSAGTLTGAAFVVFGKNTAVDGAFAATLDLGTLNGADGFRMDGEFAHDRFGLSVASAGDINGDGVEDLLVGAWGSDHAANGAGATYVVFGRDTAIGGTFAASFDVATLDGTNGFRIDGVDIQDLSGTSVAALGDVNGDGVGDIVIGAPGATPNGHDSGAAYVVFGRNTAVDGDFSAVLQLSTLDGTNGFALQGEGPLFDTGHSVSSAGDVNGDGIEDILVGAYYGGANGVYGGVSYVIFGRDTAVGGDFAASLQLSALDGTNGFRILGEQDYDYSGWSVASAGDLNDDGIDDLVIGAFRASPDGHRSGSTYVVFGRNTAADGDFTADVSLGGLTGANGFKINGVYVAGASHDASGWSVASAGDVNNDGLNDLIIGGVGASGNGNDSGAAYVVYGLSPTLDGTPQNDTLTGTGGRDRIYGLDGNDRLYGRQGDDSLYGGAGADQLFGDQGADRLDGGAGNDTLDGGAGADAMAGGAGNDIYYVDDPGDTVSENSGEGYDIVRSGVSWTLGDNIEGLQLQGSGDIDGTGNGLANNIQGNSGKNTLHGGDGADTLNGYDGNDKLFGDAGGDILHGGEGNDILDGGDGGDTLDGGAGNDKLYGGAGNDSLTGGAGADQLSGDAGNDTLKGGEGNDTLDGGTGNDTMAGGAGNDIYYVDSRFDVVAENTNEGYDIVRSSITWTLGDNVEGLELQGSGNLNGTGNGLANNIQGNSGANTLSGGAGNDTLNGADGADRLIGGTGNDILSGGSGADTFVVLQESVHNPTLEIDQILDFSTAQGDRLDLSAIDADSTTAGDQAFTLVSSFGHHAGEMTLSYNGAVTVLNLDVNGDGVSDYQLKINGDVHADSGGWVL